MLKPIGNKILVKPLYQDETARQLIAAMKSEDRTEFVSKLAAEMAGDVGPITLVTTVPPVSGRVIAIGAPHCRDCRQPIDSQVSVGDVVVYRKEAGLEITVDRVVHVLMTPQDVLLIWRPDSLKETA